MNNRCVVLFSGGTDSTCAAAIAAEKFSEIHLLTYSEEATRKSLNFGKDSRDALKEYFKDTSFIHKHIMIDGLLKYLCYKKYIKKILKHGLFVIATTGYSSLCWHLRTIIYCKKNNIIEVRDGLTKEWVHLPGHMSLFISFIKEIYQSFGINYENSVRDWETPRDQVFLDNLIVDQHGYMFPNEKQDKTTGRYLYEKGIFTHPNIKGSKKDMFQQQDCYPQVVYNIVFFWFFQQLYDYNVIEIKMVTFFKEEYNSIRSELKKCFSHNEETKLRCVLSDEILLQ